MNARYTAHHTVHARTYQEAITRLGKDMDVIWGNGNWSLASCDTRPLHFDVWEWDFDVVWHGLVKG